MLWRKPDLERCAPLEGRGYRQRGQRDAAFEQRVGEERTTNAVHPTARQRRTHRQPAHVGSQYGSHCGRGRTKDRGELSRPDDLVDERRESREKKTGQQPPEATSGKAERHGSLTRAQLGRISKSSSRGSKRV